MSESKFNSLASRRVFLGASSGWLGLAAVGAARGAQPPSSPDGATTESQPPTDPNAVASPEPLSQVPEPGSFPLKAISSENGLEATRKAYERLLDGADTLDAAIAGVTLVEDDPNETSVGYGGLPNEDGVVELDAAVMHGPTHRAGAVAALRNVRNPAQVARKVMQETDHILLVGEGALRFAQAQGFQEQNLLTEKARKIWLYWRQTRSDIDDWLPPPDDQLDPDVRKFFKRPTGTVHCATMNAQGEISCVTSTSGLAFKLAGRVGDSPILGAGLYVDNNIGSCGSTGRGEANLANLCSFAAVELMRGGMSPADAGLTVLQRVVEKTVPRLLDADGRPKFDLKFYLLAKDGSHAGVSMWGPAKISVTDAEGTRHEPCVALFERAQPGEG